MIWFTAFFFLLFRSKYILFVSKYFYIDTFSVFMLFLIPFIFFLISEFLNRYTNLLNFKEIFTVVGIICGFLCLSFVSSSPFLFLFRYEICAFPILFLIFRLSKDLEKIESVFFMLFINVFGSIFFIIFCYGFYISDMVLLSSFFFFFSDLFIYRRFFLLLVIKFPLFLFHSWLTKAHVRGSGACSIILASVMLKLGTFGFFKFSSFFLIIVSTLLSFLICFCTLRCLIVLLWMVRMFDVKLLVACSSIIHMRCIVPSLIFCSRIGVVSSVLIIIGHGVVSYILFLLVSVCYERSYRRCIDLVKRVESVSKSLTLLIFFFFFVNLGVPPFIRFISELLFTNFFFSYSVVGVVFFCLSIFFGVVYLMYYLCYTLFGKKNSYLIGNLTISVMCWSFFSLIGFFFAGYLGSFVSLIKTFFCGKNDNGRCVNEKILLFVRVNFCSFFNISFFDIFIF